MNELEEKIKNSNVIDVLIGHLNNNGLINDLANHLFITKKRSDITNKISYYKDLNGNLYNLYEIKSGNLDKTDMEKLVFYRCEEIEKLYFDNNFIDEKKTLNFIPSIAYRKSKVTYQPIKTDNEEALPILKDLIKQYPLLFVEIIFYYNIDINELINNDSKKLILNKTKEN